MSNFEILLIILGLAVVIVSLLRRLHLPPILGYLIAGACVGPYGLGLLESKEEIRYIAEFGVVFLMFSIGLELSLPKLISMRRALLGLGGLQVLICTLIALVVAKMAGMTWAGAIAISGALALSSTAVATKQLVEQDELDQTHGKLALAILLFQDLAAVPFLIVVPALAGVASKNSLGQVLLQQIGLGVLIVIAMLAAGRWLLRPLFHHIAQARSSELFMLTALLVVLGAAFLTEYCHLSAALGAFLAGVMLAETEYVHQIESDIQPFRDILLGFFFISVGLVFDPSAVMEDWQPILMILISLILLKTIIIALLAKLAGTPTKTSLRTGLVLAQGGEFGLFLIAVAYDLNIINVQHSQIIIAATLISMAVSPLLIRNNKKIALFFLRYLKQPIEEPLEEITPSKDLKGHVIICGYGRVGQTLARFLEYENINFVGLDIDPVRLREARAASEPVFFGDPTQENVLIAAGITKARMLIIAFGTSQQSLKILRAVRQVNKEIPILVRTMDDTDLEALQIAGATEVIPDKLESSLMLASHMLILLGQTPAKAQQQIAEVKANRYKMLRGFFEGENIGHLEDYQSEKIYLHAVELSESAYAIGHTLEELVAQKIPIKISSFSRHGFKCNHPSAHTVFKAGDILVLEGTHEEIYLVEEKLLQG
ncbi:MAG: cation:proton antiporter [Proteobacteria bacterium]|nr:cation:proton antiporter [Pseudomonadota bacterium]